MKRTFAGIALALACLTRVASAQQPPAGPTPAPGSDPLAGNFFPPEMIMQNQQALGLTEEQKSAMIMEIQRTQGAATTIQWRLQQQVERLGGLVREARVDEAAVLVQLDSVLTTEREMKRTQITLLVRLKNRLTPDQQAMLRQRMASAR